MVELRRKNVRPSRRLIQSVGCVFLLMVLLPARASSAQPNIVLIVSDDQRPDTIAALGNKLIRTPSLDRLVRDGIAFTRATCGNPICTPSRAEILSGSCSFRNGVLDFGRKIHEDLPTMAKWFDQAGYNTWYVGKWHNDGLPVQRGYDRTNGLYRGGGGKFYKPQVDWANRPVTGYRGWIFQDDKGKLFPERGVGLTGDISSKFANAAIELIKQPNDKPFFLHVNFTAPHDPLMLPVDKKHLYAEDDLELPTNFLARHGFDHGNFDGRDEKLFAWPRTKKETLGELAAYYAVISDMDEQIGRLLATLDQLKLRKNTIVVFASDHGLGVGSHGLRGKQSMYEHTIGVPLLVSGPTIPRNQRRVAQCYLRDIFPTLCDLAKVKKPTKIDGVSLKPIIDKTADEIHPFVVGYFRNFQRMIRKDHRKYIFYPEAKVEQFFDLNDDPFEKKNLVKDDSRRDDVNELRNDLHAWLKQHGDPLFKE
jgi:arylsulfatase A-like enzyme